MTLARGRKTRTTSRTLKSDEEIKQTRTCSEEARSPKQTEGRRGGREGGGKEEIIYEHIKRIINGKLKKN